MAKKNVAATIANLKKTEESTAQTMTDFIAERLKNQAANAEMYAIPVGRLPSPDDDTAVVGDGPFSQTNGSSTSDFPALATQASTMARSERSVLGRQEKPDVQFDDLDKYCQELMAIQDAGDTRFVQSRVSKKVYDVLSLVSSFSKHTAFPLTINQVAEYIIAEHVNLHRSALKQMKMKLNRINENSGPVF